MSTADDILDKLTLVLANDIDPDDVPGLSKHQRDSLHIRRIQMTRQLTGLREAERHVRTLLSSLASDERELERLLAIRTQLQHEIDDAPPWQRFGGGGHAATAEWRRQDDLRAGITALQRGVEYFGGVPAVPNRLMELLENRWTNSIPVVQERIEQRATKLAVVEAERDSYLQNAEALLAEPVTT